MPAIMIAVAYMYNLSVMKISGSVAVIILNHQPLAQSNKRKALGLEGRGNIAPQKSRAILSRWNMVGHVISRVPSPLVKRAKSAYHTLLLYAGRKLFGVPEGNIINCKK